MKQPVLTGHARREDGLLFLHQIKQRKLYALHRASRIRNCCIPLPKQEIRQFAGCHRIRFLSQAGFDRDFCPAIFLSTV